MQSFRSLIPSCLTHPLPKQVCPSLFYNHRSNNASIKAQETKGQPPACYDFQHKPNFHSLDRQRYVSPTTGKCRWLRVQCASSTQSSPIRGATRGKEVDVSGRARRALKLAYWLAQHSPFSEYFPEWVGRWLWLILCLLKRVKSAPYEDTYKPYLSKFWGQLWAARSEKEYSLRVPGRGLLLRPDHKGDVYSITHAAYPRQLIVHDGTNWRVCIDPNALARMEYIAISYKNSDFTTPQIDGNYEVTKEVQQSYVSALARSICLELGATAYWLDFECTGELQAEKNEDLYRFADVFRGASRTVILIRDRYLFPLNSTEIPSRTKQQRDEEEASGWKSWGERVWTFPEALLSSELAYKFGSEPVRSISLREVGNIAYGPDQEEMRLINGFSGKDPLERIERLALLKNAIWRRSSASSPAPHSPQKVNPGTGRPFTAFPAERVYALMGFFEHRIMPDNQESVWHALARLSMANDSDHLVERMIAMLPPSIPDWACWYSDEDIFGAKLWDIDPEVQVAGITSSGALVVDGCRAAAIRWKDFPEVACLRTGKRSFRRAICAAIPQIFAYVLLIGLLCLGASVAIGVSGFGM